MAVDQGAPQQFNPIEVDAFRVASESPRHRIIRRSAGRLAAAPKAIEDAGTDLIYGQYTKDAEKLNDDDYARVRELSRFAVRGVEAFAGYTAISAVVGTQFFEGKQEALIIGAVTLSRGMGMFRRLMKVDNYIEGIEHPERQTESKRLVAAYKASINRAEAEKAEKKMRLRETRRRFITEELGPWSLIKFHQTSNRFFGH